MSELDVLLVKTPLVRFGFNISGVYPLPHLGLGYLGAILARHGFRVGYIDAQFSDQDPRQNPDALPDAHVYALTAKVTNITPTHDIARIIQGRRPEAAIVVGGPCNVFRPNLLFDQFPAFDLLATGEGENMVLPLVEALLAGKRGEELSRIPGLAIRDGQDILVTEPVLPADLEEELHPLRSLWRSGRRTDRMHPPYGVYPPVALMEAARGCSYRCSFCVISQNLRHRPVDVVIREMEELIREEDAREIHFVDPTFTLDIGRTAALCEAMEGLPRPVKWSCKTRTDAVNPEILEKMARAGCYMIAYGIESGADRILGSLNKQLDVRQTEKALRWTHEAGVRSLGYVLVGSPGESDESIAETNRFLRRSKVWFVLFGVNMPAPGARSQDADGKAREAELLRYYALGELGSHPEKSFFGHHHRKLNAWMLKSMLGVYLHPPSLFRVLRGLSGPRELFHYISGAGHMGLEFARYKLRRRWKRGVRELRFSDGRGNALDTPHVYDTRKGIFPKIRAIELWFFRSPAAWIFGYAQKYLAAKLYREEAENLVDESWNDKSLLDVGCGHGTFLLEIGGKTRGMKMLGIDQSPSLISFARRSVRLKNGGNGRLLKNSLIPRHEWRGENRKPRFSVFELKKSTDGLFQHPDGYLGAVSQQPLDIRFEVMDAHDLKFSDDSFDFVTSTSSIYLWHDPIQALNGIHRVLKPGGRAYIADQTRAGSAGDFYQSWFKQRIYGCGIPSYTNEELIDFFESSNFDSFRHWFNGVVIWFEAIKSP